MKLFHIFRAQYTPYPVDVTISNVKIETAVPFDSGLGIANFVEQCLCPKGYTGLSCEVSTQIIYCTIFPFFSCCGVWIIFYGATKNVEWICSLVLLLSI